MILGSTLYATVAPTCPAEITAHAERFPPPYPISYMEQESVDEEGRGWRVHIEFETPPDELPTVAKALAEDWLEGATACGSFALIDVDIS